MFMYIFIHTVLSEASKHLQHMIKIINMCHVNSTVSQKSLNSLFSVKKQTLDKIFPLYENTFKKMFQANGPHSQNFS
uniref:Uncharacterized protein n=1 Tax=Anguilla anguilla TaxID=7936 RepID=A0A0E9X0P1_ANGAN